MHGFGSSISRTFLSSAAGGSASLVLSTLLNWVRTNSRRRNYPLLAPTSFAFSHQETFPSHINWRSLLHACSVLHSVPSFSAGFMHALLTVWSLVASWVSSCVRLTSSSSSCSSLRTDWFITLCFFAHVGPAVFSSTFFTVVLSDTFLGWGFSFD